jgi:hypothetical protein
VKRGERIVVELIIGMKRFDESWNLLEKMRPEDINALKDDDKKRLSLFKAQVLVEREEFDTAIAEIEPFVNRTLEVYQNQGVKSIPGRHWHIVVRGRTFSKARISVKRLFTKNRFIMQRFSGSDGRLFTGFWGIIRQYSNLISACPKTQNT